MIEMKLKKEKEKEKEELDENVFVKYQQILSLMIRKSIERNTIRCNRLS